MHTGHRQRLREKIDADCVKDHELIEAYLFPSLPRVNTNEIAHRLLDAFESIEGIFSASKKQLLQIEGIGPKTADHIRLTSKLIRQMLIDSCHKNKIGSNEFERRRYTLALFFGLYEEKTFMLMFSKNEKFIGCVEIGSGSYWECRVSMKQALACAVSHKATSVIFAHNHPDGITVPSDADIETSRLLTVSFGNADIKVTDHVLIADNTYVSFVDKIKLY